MNLNEMKGCGILNFLVPKRYSSLNSSLFFGKKIFRFVSQKYRKRPFKQFLRCFMLTDDSFVKVSQQLLENVKKTQIISVFSDELIITCRLHFPNQFCPSNYYINDIQRERDITKHIFDHLP